MVIVTTETIYAPDYHKCWEATKTESFKLPNTTGLEKLWSQEPIESIIFWTKPTNQTNKKIHISK